MSHAFFTRDVLNSVMSVCHPQLIYSSDPDVLVEHVFTELADRNLNWPDHRAFLIVPEYLKADMERRYITASHAGGLMMAEVLSFRRLATRLFSQTGQQASQSISNAGKAILVQGALLDPDQPFRRFHKMAGQPHYAVDLVNILGDFHRYEITNTDLLTRNGSPKLQEEQIPKARQVTIDKLHDFAILARILENELRERDLVDPDTSLARLAGLLTDHPRPQRLNFLSHSHVWILGFGGDRNFTSQERSVLSALARQVATLSIAIPAGGDGRGSDPAFYHGRETLRSLSRLLPSSEKHELRRPTPRPKPLVHLVRAIDRQEEARYTAGEIRRLLLTTDLRRREIGIALCEPDEMIAYLEAALEEYGVDAYLEASKPLKQSSFMRLLTAFLSLCSYDFTLDHLMDYYRSGLTILPNPVIDRFENAALANGWKGARDLRAICASKHSLQTTIDRCAYSKTEERKELRHALENVKKILDITSAMRQTRTGRAKADLLLDFLFGGPHAEARDGKNRAEASSQNALSRNFLDGSPASRVMKQRDTLLLQNHEKSALLLVSAWNAAIDFLYEAGDLLGDARMSQDHFSRMLLAGLESLSLSSIPVGTDRVRVGSLTQMAARPCRVLFIVGALETAFPAEIKQEGYLRDEERDFLAERSGKPFPSRKKDQPASQAWLVRALLERPSEHLYLSVPTLGEGRSPIYDSLRAQTEGEQETIVDKPGPVPDARWNALKAASRILRRNDQAPTIWRQAVRMLTGIDDPIRQTADQIAESFSLSRPIVASALARYSGISISMLQQYNACPFRFFTQYLAGAWERVVAEDRVNAQGTLLHRLLELATIDLTGSLEQARDGEDKEQIIDEWGDRLTPTYMRELYSRATERRDLSWYARPQVSGGVGERLRIRAVNTLKILSDFDRENVFTPYRLEWSFPEPGRPPYGLTVEGHHFPFRGLVDRIDEDPQGTLRLIDYKRSGKVFSWLELLDGTDLQLPLYKRAFETAYPGRSVSELFFAGFDSPRVRELTSFSALPYDTAEELRLLRKQKQVWVDESVDKTARFAEAKASDTLKAILEGDFAAQPLIRGSYSNPCQYCDWYAACGYDKRLARNVVRPTSKEDKESAKKQILDQIGTDDTI
ncbi:MAG TPA: PD-(D/E)XK nuclease family protein [Clostridia bacterium]|nr:PD-(D/E)XK nuclease family protein [Clostridia bacterium]